MKKNKIIENIKIEKVGYHGIGISNLEDGKKVIINGGVLPDSIVDARVIKVKKDYIECQLIRIKKLSDKYKLCNDLCPHYFFNVGGEEDRNSVSGCGGCKWQILDYKDQLEIKRQIVIDSFRHIKNSIKDFDINEIEIVANNEQYEYRNKIEFSFGKYLVLDKNSEEKKYAIAQNWNLGFHKQGEFSKVLNIGNCRLIDKKLNEILNHIRDILIESGLPVYDQKIHKGFFRHLVFRYGINTNQILVNLSVSDEYFNNASGGQGEYKKWTQVQNKLQSDEYIKNNITSFVVTYNNSLADIVKGPDIKQETLFGDGFIFEKLNIGGTEVNFRVSPFSFFQTNTHGAEKLFNTAIEIFGNNKGFLLDLYCGTGSIGISFLKAQIFDKLIGIEIVQDAIDDAKYNAKINGLEDKSNFYCGKAEELLTNDEELKAQLNDLNSIIIDPPREGLHKKVITFLGDLKKIKNYKLLYISCNPVTMARDVEMLIELGFKLKSLKAVDMFPNTNHVESIGLLY